MIHPEPLLKILEAYFRIHGLPLQRSIYLLHMPGILGLTDIYNIHPMEDWGHFELLLNYIQDHVLPPRRPESTLPERPVEVWDDTYMEAYHAQFDWKTGLTPQDEKDLIAYFESAEWKKQ